MVRAATVTAVRASISTPVCAAILAEAVMVMRSRDFGILKVTSQCVMGRGWQSGINSPVFFGAMMPATRAVARELMALSVAFCRRISPEAMASRRRIGLAETSTMLASPWALMWVSLLMG